MIKVHHICSGSSGNAIVVDDGHSKLMFDCGRPYSALSKEVKFSEIEAVFVSHEHGDHSKACQELLRRGIRVASSYGTKVALTHKGDAVKEMEVMIHGSEKTVGTWLVKAFDVDHDAAEPLGFLFQSLQTGKKGVYIVDSSQVNYTFKGIDTWIVEANYSDELLEQSEDHIALKNRIRNTHFSIEKLEELISLHNHSEIEQMHLIHVSQRNGNPNGFMNQLQKRFGFPVYVLE